VFRDLDFRQRNATVSKTKKPGGERGLDSLRKQAGQALKTPFQRSVSVIAILRHLCLTLTVVRTILRVLLPWVPLGRHTMKAFPSVLMVVKWSGPSLPEWRAYEIQSIPLDCHNCVVRSAGDPVRLAAQAVKVDGIAKRHFTTFDIRGAGKNQGQGTWPMGVNSAGVITGYYVDSGNVSHGFLRTSDGKISKFNVPEAGKGPNQGTIPLSIHTTGAIMGSYIDSGTDIPRIPAHSRWQNH
jgi:hypothetical protein